MWSNDKRDNQSREAARGLIKSVGQIENTLTRLQVQQQMLEERLSDIKSQVVQLREDAKNTPFDKRDFEELRNRIMMLETVLTTLMKDVDDEFVSDEDFERYKQALQDKADQLRVELAEDKVKKIRTTRQQLGLVLGGIGLVIAPKVWDYLAWLIENVLPLLLGG